METIKELNMNELEQICGGGSFCLVLGGSSTPEASVCPDEGYSTSDNMVGAGATVCAFVGIGLGGFWSKD